MKALLYLIFTQMKNRILALRKKPGMMILYGVVFLGIIASVIVIIFSGNKPIDKSFADNRILYLFLTGFGLLYLFTFTYSGLSTGSTFFSMADVGLLFVAPISSKKILFYGLLSTIGKTMLTSIFILYQVPNLSNLFGYSFMEVLSLFLIYVVMVIFFQILSMAIYIFSNGNSNRKKLVRALLYGLFGLIIASAYLIMQKENVGILDSMKLLVDSKWFGLLPAVGWPIMFFKGVITGSIVQAVVALALFVILAALFVSLLTANKADYYEDVLYSTEITYQRIMDYKEGRNLSSASNRKVKVSDKEKSILKGKGAIVFAYKHILEIKRSSRFVFIDGYTILLTIAAGITGYSLKNEMGAYIMLATLIYMLYFITILGRLKLELMNPYIYMVPESSFKKLLAASMSSILKPCVDSIFIFSIFAIVGGASIIQCIFMALAYSCSGALFLGLTVVYQRVLGGQPNKVAQVFIGIFLLLIVITPAVTASILIALFVLPESLQFLSTLPYSMISLISAFFMFYACRNLLDNTEISNRV